jgi:hypothetical protein
MGQAVGGRLGVDFATKVRTSPVSCSGECVVSEASFDAPHWFIRVKQTWAGLGFRALVLSRGLFA